MWNINGCIKQTDWDNQVESSYSSLISLSESNFFRSREVQIKQQSKKKDFSILRWRISQKKAKLGLKSLIIFLEQAECCPLWPLRKKDPPPLCFSPTVKYQWVFFQVMSPLQLGTNSDKRHKGEFFALSGDISKCIIWFYKTKEFKDED